MFFCNLHVSAPYALPNYLLSGLLTYSILLTLPRSLTFTPAQFTEVSAANPEVVLELTTNGTLIEFICTGDSTGAHNSRSLAQLENWAADSDLSWIFFAGTIGFLLTDGSARNPDASVVRLERWQALCKAEREGFPPLCPDLVVELASHSDQPHDLIRKVVAAQGAPAAAL